MTRAKARAPICSPWLAVVAKTAFCIQAMFFLLEAVEKERAAAKTAASRRVVECAEQHAEHRAARRAVCAALDAAHYRDMARNATMLAKECENELRAGFLTREFREKHDVERLCHGACVYARWLTSGGNPHVHLNPSEGYRVYTVAASLGSTTAKAGLSGMTFMGLGTEKRLVLGLVQMAMAAGGGSEAARLMLGSIFENGLAPVDKDDNIAEALYAGSRHARYKDASRAARLEATRRLGLFKARRTKTPRARRSGKIGCDLVPNPLERRR